MDLEAKSDTEFESDIGSENEGEDEGDNTGVESEAEAEAEADEDDNDEESELEIKDDNDEEDDDDDDEDDDNERPLFQEDTYQSYVKEYHPELSQMNIQDIQKYSQVTRNKNGVIIDAYHKTVPFLTKFEKTRVIGIRTSQLDYGAEPLIPIDSSIMDSNVIALKELEANVLPFIISRPLPNGKIEYWNIQDLERLE